MPLGLMRFSSHPKNGYLLLPFLFQRCIHIDLPRRDGDGSFPRFESGFLHREFVLSGGDSEPVTADTLVSFVVDNATAAMVSPSATITSGQSSATFTVTGLAPAGSVTIGAVLNGAEVTSHVQVVGP